MITIVIVEDLIEHQIYFRSIIERDLGIHCLAICSNGQEAIEIIPKLQPSIVLIDIGLPDISGIDCIKKLKPTCPETKFMVVTIHDEDESLFEALKAGASGYMLKKSKPHQIVDAICELNDGGAPISSEIARKLLLEIPKIRNQDLKIDEFHITNKEVEILNLLARGFSYQEIADKLFISIKTFKKHIHNIYNKLHADNRTEALNSFFGTNAKSNK